MNANEHDCGLEELLRRAAARVMTPLDLYEQKLSWVYGEVNMNRPADREITKAQIEADFAKMGVLRPLA